MRLSQPLIMTLAFLLAGCGLFRRDGVIRGSGRLASEAREVATFAAVVLDGQGEVVVEQGPGPALTVEAEDNLLPLITTEVVAGTLRLAFDRTDWRQAIAPTLPIRFALRVPDLQSITIAGSGSVRLPALRTESLEVRVTGDGTLLAERLVIGDLDVLVSGTGHLTLAGAVERQAVAFTGQGSYEAGDLESQQASVEISGTGDATVWVEQELAVRISGSGSVSYFGDPIVAQRDITGLGDINPLGAKR